MDVRRQLALPSRNEATQSYRHLPVREVSSASPKYSEGTLRRILIGICLGWDKGGRTERIHPSA